MPYGLNHQLLIKAGADVRAACKDGGEVCLGGGSA